MFIINCTQFHSDRFGVLAAGPEATGYHYIFGKQLHMSYWSVCEKGKEGQDSEERMAMIARLGSKGLRGKEERTER